jgi:hypothetical protein
MGGIARRGNQEKEQFWRRIVTGQAGSGLSIRRYCSERGVNEPSFFAWRKELARRDAAANRGGRDRGCRAGGRRRSSLPGCRLRPANRPATRASRLSCRLASASGFRAARARTRWARWSLTTCNGPAAR